MILFKLFQMTLGRADKLQILLKNFLRRKMISYRGRNSTGILFRRDFTFSNNSIAVKDSINVKVPEEDFRFGLKASYNFIPSSKYFTTQEVGNKISVCEKQHFFTAEEGRSLLRIFYLI